MQSLKRVFYRRRHQFSSLPTSIHTHTNICNMYMNHAFIYLIIYLPDIPVSEQLFDLTDFLRTLTLACAVIFRGPTRHLMDEVRNGIFSRAKNPNSFR